MTAREVAAVLREISQLLQLKGENAFKVRAYDLAADAFEALPGDPAAPAALYERVQKGTLSELAGVGKAIDQKVTELVRNGSLKHLGVRRYGETNADVEIVAAGDGPVEAIMEAFATAPGATEVLARGGTKCSVRMREPPIQADLRVVTGPQFATALHHFTGSKQHHVK